MKCEDLEVFYVLRVIIVLNTFLFVICAYTSCPRKNAPPLSIMV